MGMEFLTAKKQSKEYKDIQVPHLEHDKTFI